MLVFKRDFLRTMIVGHVSACHDSQDGKEHCYWSIVQNKRLSDGRVLQRHVPYLGEINSSQELAWRKSMEVFEEGAERPRMLALFPEDRCEALATDAVLWSSQLSWTVGTLKLSYSG